VLVPGAGIALDFADNAGKAYTVMRGTGHTIADSAYNAVAFGVAEYTGYASMEQAVQGSTVFDQRPLSQGERWYLWMTGGIQFATTVVGGLYGATGAIGRSAGAVCFPPDTPVAVVGKGYIPIIAIEEGDKVWGYDFEHGAWTPAEVEHKFHTPSLDNLVTVATESGKVEMTAGHPVWVLEGEALEARPPVEHLLPHEHEGGRLPGRWVLADDVRVDDRVMLRLNGPATVTGLTVRPADGPVVNLKVKDLRTFCVGLMDLLVHNTNSAASQLPRLQGRSVNEITGILERNGFVRTNPGNPRNQTWRHPDGSEVRIHPYGNLITGPYATGNNAHVHRQNSAGRQLDDRGIVSIDPNQTHIGIPNPPDFPIVAGRPHGIGR
jgi:hypothetical protein